VGTGPRLSEERAAAVVKNLVDKYGIASARPSPFGAGPYCPVATHLTEDGRAQNRRVELVPQ
jgi:OmpA-OmpF porin, OOP family